LISFLFCFLSIDWFILVNSKWTHQSHERASVLALHQKRLRDTIKDELPARSYVRHKPAINKKSLSAFDKCVKHIQCNALH
jgi:hypothetical protein